MRGIWPEFATDFGGEEDSGCAHESCRAQPTLLRCQRLYRIDGRGAPGGHIACGEGRNDQNTRGTGERGRIDGRDAE